MITGIANPHGIALDIVGRKIYWISFHHATVTSTIHRSNWDGTNIEDLVTSGLGVARRIALDVQAGKMYWTHEAPGHSIERANLDGTGVETLLTDGFITLDGLALDINAGKMYFSDFHSSAHRIGRANLDGTAPQTLTSNAHSPYGISLDTQAGKIYWVNGLGLDIQRSNLDGTSVETLLSGIQHLRKIALQFNIPPREATQNLINDVIALNLQQGISNSLDAKLEAVIAALEDVNSNNDVAAINSLGAFIAAVEAQSGQKITTAAADALILAAQAIIDALVAGS